MDFGNLAKAFIVFISLVFIGAFISLIYSAVVGSAAWDLVPDGLSKSFVVLIPLIIVIAGFVIAIKIATSSKKEE